MRSQTIRLAAVLAAVLLALAAGAARAEKTEHKDSLEGHDKKDYTISAKAGQTLTIWLKSNSSFAYFNVTPVGADEPIWVGTVQGKEKAFVHKLDAPGDYEILVYLTKGEARRNGKAEYTLTISLD
jgi:plastocyanin